MRAYRIVEDLEDSVGGGDRRTSVTTSGKLAIYRKTGLNLQLGFIS
jgi:hypothetical protein